MDSKPKVLLFDLDGTLVRTGGAGIRALTRAFQIQYPIENPLEGVTIAGNTDPNIFREIIAKNFPGKTSEPEAEKLFFKNYLLFLKEEIHLSKDYQVLPGIFEILKRAASMPDVFLGLGTGNLEEGARIKLERGGLNPYFTFGGFGSDSADRNQVLKIAVERAEREFGLKFELQDIFVIGDTPRDIQAARAIGAKVLCVATGGYALEDLEKHEPDFVLKNFGNVEEFFQSLNSRMSRLAPFRQSGPD